MGRKYRFKTKPYKHQVKALRILLRNEGGALFMPMRSGKTKVVIDFIGALYIKYRVTKILIVCPLSAMGVWRNEIRKHMPEEIRKAVSVKILNYERLYEREQYYEEDEQGEVERGWVPVDNDELMDFGADVMILDESHRIGNPSSLVSKKAYKLGDRKSVV